MVVVSPLLGDQSWFRFRRGYTRPEFWVSRLGRNKKRETRRSPVCSEIVDSLGAELLPVEGPARAVFFSQEAVGFRTVGHFHLPRVVVELLANVVGHGGLC